MGKLNYSDPAMSRVRQARLDLASARIAVWVGMEVTAQEVYGQTLASRIESVLSKEGKSIEDLVGMTREEIMVTPGLGSKAISRIEEYAGMKLW